MDDEDDGSAVDTTTTDEDSSDSGMDPWDSTIFPSDSRDESASGEAGWGDSEDDDVADGDDDDVADGEDGEEGEGDDVAGGEDEGDGNVAGALAPDVPVEPGRPDPMNVLFVVFGAYLGVLAIASLVGTGGSITIVEYAAVSVGFFALAGLAYGFLTRSNPDT